MSLPGEEVTGEIGNDATVSDLQAGTVVVEGPRDGDRKLELLGIVDTERLAEPLGFVVTGARARARDVSAIGFRRGNLIRRWIAVDFAGRQIEKTGNRKLVC